MLTIFLQWAGHTCGIEDLTLTDAAENARQEIILKVKKVEAASIRGCDGPARHGLPGLEYSPLSVPQSTFRAMEM